MEVDGVANAAYPLSCHAHALEQDPGIQANHGAIVKTSNTFAWCGGIGMLCGSQAQAAPFWGDKRALAPGDYAFSSGGWLQLCPTQVLDGPEGLCVGLNCPLRFGDIRDEAVDHP